MELLKDFINYLRIEKCYSEHTVRAYVDDIVQFTIHLNTVSIHEDVLAVGQSDIRNWIIALVNKGNSPRTLRRKLASLNAFYNHCLRSESIKTNPAQGVILPKIKRNLPEFIKESSINSILERSIFPKSFSGIRDHLVLELFYSTGIRLSELIHLENVNIDLNKGEAKIMGKQSKERIIPLTENIIKLIDEYYIAAEAHLGTDKKKYLILTDKGSQTYPRMIQRLVHKYLSLSTTMDRKNPHLFRHTFATHMLNSGADLNAVKEILGHASLAATEIYTHNTYEKLKSIYKQAHPRA